MRTLRSVLDLFPSTRDNGLSPTQRADSASRFGQNRLTPLPRESVWLKFLEKFDEPIIKILLAASLLKIVIDLFDASVGLGIVSLLLVPAVFAMGFVPALRKWIPASLFALAIVLVILGVVLRHPSYEGLAVMIAVALATGVAFISEYRSDREFELLNQRKDAITVKILEQGTVRNIALEELVVGDLVLLEPGDEIPADGRPTQARELLVDQSLMTGESEPVAKHPTTDPDETDSPEQPSCLFRGCQVVGGIGQMLVTNVGDDTMLGQIARRLSAGPSENEGDRFAAAGDRIQKKLAISKTTTPLQEKLEVLAHLISKIGYIAAVLIFLVQIGHGIYDGELRLPQGNESSLTVLLANFRALLGYVVYMVIIIVVAVPEGLPMSVTVSLALAMRKMTRANSLVRQLVACETIGSATVICTDKTGTLTQNRMTVAWLGTASKIFRAKENDSLSDPKFAEAANVALEQILRNAILNSTAHLGKDRGETIGNTTEAAILRWISMRSVGDSPADSVCDVQYLEERKKHTPIYQVPFSSERKRMTTVVSHDGKPTLLIKGAPEVILDRCTHVIDADGKVRELTAEGRKQIESQLAEAAELAMRTLAFASREFAEVPTSWEEADKAGELEKGLIFSGFVGIRDPLRPDVAEAIAQCRAAGIEVKLITGDTPVTAKAIAREVGLLDRPDVVTLSHDEFQGLSDEQLKERMPEVRVLARAKPLDKLRMVRMLQQQGHVVAMTGDGTNDAVSLRAADVGLAMGLSGTEVAKEASKIVLLDDSFATIVNAVRWGRSLYENIQKFLQFQLTINVSALVITFLGALLGLHAPFTVLQLLWINVIMDTFAAIALCSDPPRKGLMQVKPKRRDEKILTPSMMNNILITGSFFVLTMLILLYGMQKGGWFAGDQATITGHNLTLRQGTLFFTIYVLLQLWNLINCRSLDPSVSGLHGLYRNPLFLLIAFAIVVVQIAIVSFGGVIFMVEPLSLVDWLVIGVATSSVLLFAELTRRFRAR